jgi:hypothetical protein
VNGGEFFEDELDFLVVGIGDVDFLIWFLIEFVFDEEEHFID